jgi:DNA polymerase-4
MTASAPRKIIHIDMDAFYASVEIRDNPELAGLPVVVGGPPAGRGVVAAASYEARKYGIHSAMPSARAYRLCPQAVFLRPDFGKYQRVSAQIHGIFHRYTPLVEGVSLDEAYLDVTRNLAGEPSATRIAQAIKRDILAETRLTASAGVAPNKFLAKVASEERKPNGLFVIRPRDVAAFMLVLPVEKVPGVGQVTLKRLRSLGIATCGDMQRLSLAELTHHFGRRGEYFHRICRGIDGRPVEPERERKSVSVEDTFAEDHGEADWLLAKLEELARRLQARMAEAGAQGRTVTLKLKLADFRSFTRSRTLSHPVSDAATLCAVGRELFAQSGLAGQKLRLLGLGVSHLEDQPRSESGNRQLSLWDGAAAETLSAVDGPPG